MKNLNLVSLISLTLLFAGCSSIPFSKIDPYVVSPMETGPNQYIVVARASDLAGGEPLVRQLALNKARNFCLNGNNSLQVTEIQNGRWSKGATIDIFFSCLTNNEKNIILSESVSRRNSPPKKEIKVYRPELVKGLEGVWFKYAETNNEDYYILSNIYETSSNTREAWAMYDLKQSSKFGSGSIKVLYEHQCSNELIQGRSRAIKTVEYDGAMGQGNITKTINARTNWKKIQPYTMSYERQSLVCN